MPVIQFTQADFMQAKTMEAGPYKAMLTEVDGPKASASQKSVSFFCKFRIVEGKYTNKELTLAFNSATGNSSVLGSLQFCPHNWFLKVAAAVKGQLTIDGISENVDTDDLMDKPIDIIVGIETSEGNIINTINGFLPEEKGSETPSF